jgi:hypothetical protein
MSCNSNFNTEPIINTIKETLENELNKLLINYVERYNLLENTHKGIMSLPSVKKELNQSIHESEKSINNNNNIPLDLGEIKTIVYDLVKSEFKKHEIIIEKNNDTNNNNEIKQWTNTIIDLQKEIFELKEFIKSSIIIQEKQYIKLEKEEKENINLEKEEKEEKENIKLEKEEKENIKLEIKEVELEEEEEEKEELQEAEVESEEKDEELEEEEEEDELEAEEELESEKEELQEAEVETEEEEEDSDEDEEYIEIEIDDIAYCTNDEENGFIYEIDKEGQPSKKVGYLKDGEAIFYE